MTTQTKTTNSILNLQPYRKTIQRTLLLWLVFLPLAVIIIIPLLYIVSRAFTHESNQFNFPIEWIPNPITFANFTHIFSDVTLPVMKWFANSLIIASVGTLIVVFLSTLSGYAFARLEFPGKSQLFSLLIFSLMIPGAVTLIPAFLLLRDLKLLNTYHAIWWPTAASVVGIFLVAMYRKGSGKVVSTIAESRESGQAVPVMAD